MIKKILLVLFLAVLTLPIGAEEKEREVLHFRVTFYVCGKPPVIFNKVRKITVSETYGEIKMEFVDGDIVYIHGDYMIEPIYE